MISSLGAGSRKAGTFFPMQLSCSAGVLTIVYFYFVLYLSSHVVGYLLINTSASSIKSLIRKDLYIVVKEIGNMRIGDQKGMRSGKQV